MITREQPLGRIHSVAETTPPNYDTARDRQLIISEIKEIIRYRNLLFHLVKRNITARYKRSLLGIGWTLLDPLLTMVVMAIVYSALFRTQIEGFPVFLLCGILVWTFFSQASAEAMTEIMYSGSLLGKVYLPKSVFAVSALGTGLTNFLISMIPLAGFVLVFQRPITPALLFLPVAIVIISAFTLGLGLLMSTFAIFFGDMVNVFSFILRLLFYMSGIFYYTEDLPDLLAWVVRLTPTYHMIRLFRDPIFEGILPQWEIIAYGSFWAVFMFILGYWYFTKRSDEIAYRI
jgi:ABC-2 type transport system permease protein